MRAAPETPRHLAHRRVLFGLLGTGLWALPRRRVPMAVKLRYFQETPHPPAPRTKSDAAPAAAPPRRAPPWPATLRHATPRRAHRNAPHSQGTWASSGLGIRPRRGPRTCPAAPLPRCPAAVWVVWAWPESAAAAGRRAAHWPRIATGTRQGHAPRKRTSRNKVILFLPSN